MGEAQALQVAKEARLAAETSRAMHLARLGQACARLHRLGWTWERMGQEMGVNLSTVYRWAQPYLPGKADGT